MTLKAKPLMRNLHCGYGTRSFLNYVIGSTLATSLACDHVCVQLFEGRCVRFRP